MGELIYYNAPEEEYTLNEVSIFIDCIMSNQINSDYILKCLTAISLQMKLSDESYDAAELDDGGNIEEFETSDFMKFVDESLVILLHDNDPDTWVVFFRDQLIKYEIYETLHYLKLEDRYPNLFNQ